MKQINAKIDEKYHAKLVAESVKRNVTLSELFRHALYKEFGSDPGEPVGTGDKPGFTCRSCGRTFRTKRNMELHECK